MITKNQIEQQISHLGDAVAPKFRELFESFDAQELCNRRNFVGHITASGTIVHLPTKEVLLLHHKGLDRWHVPGGHVDFEDASPLAAALREVEEETGLCASELIPMNVVSGIQYCVELNSHPIPHSEKKNEDAHFHHDFRFVFGFEGDKQITIDSDESLNYKWVSIDDDYIKEILTKDFVSFFDCH